MSTRPPRRGAKKPRSGVRRPAPSRGANGLTERAVQAVEALIEKARPLVAQAGPAAARAREAGRRMAIDLGGGLDAAFSQIRERARDLMAKGQHTRVRLSFRGKQLAEVPITAVAAAEVASLWWFGPLRLVLGHVVGKSMLEVEFISGADAIVAEGRGFLADGDPEKALAAFDRALAMDRRCAPAHLGRGIAFKLRGDKASARTAFEQAERSDPRGETGQEARRHLDNL